MNSELEILKKIWEEKGETNLRLVSNQTGFSLDYTYYLCQCLFEKEEIKPIEGKRDWFKITFKGKKRLEAGYLIKPKKSKKVKDTEKVVYYLPKKLKVKPSEDSFQKVNPKSQKKKLIESDEKKLNLGKSIDKAISFLKGRFNERGNN